MELMAHLTLLMTTPSSQSPRDGTFCYSTHFKAVSHPGHENTLERTYPLLYRIFSIFPREFSGRALVLGSTVFHSFSCLISLKIFPSLKKARMPQLLLVKTSSAREQDLLPELVAEWSKVLL